MPQIVRQPEYDSQRPDSGKHSGQYSCESPAVTVIGIVVGHDDGRVDYDAERNGYPRHGKRMKPDVEQTVKHDGDEYVGKQRYGNYCKIPPFEPSAHPHKHQQYDQRQRRAQHKCAELLHLLLGTVV